MGSFRDIAQGLAQKARDEERRLAFEKAMREKAVQDMGDTMQGLASMDPARRLPVFRISGKVYGRIAWGTEQGSQEQLSTCPQCRARPGELHEPGCAIEECPACGRKALVCACTHGS